MRMSKESFWQCASMAGSSTSSQITSCCSWFTTKTSPQLRQDPNKWCSGYKDIASLSSTDLESNLPTDLREYLSYRDNFLLKMVSKQTGCWWIFFKWIWSSRRFTQNWSHTMKKTSSVSVLLTFHVDMMVTSGSKPSLTSWVWRVHQK